MRPEGANGGRLTRAERRRWRSVRWRAAAGLLPGAVTETAAFQQRLLARIVLALLIPISLALLALAALLAWDVARTGGGTHLVRVHVQRVLPANTWQPARLPYAVRGDDGYVYDFALPPRLRPGDAFYAKYDGRNRYLGTVVHGRFSQVRSYGRGPIVPLVIVLIGVCALWAIVGTIALAARRRARALTADLHSEPTVTTGVYEGSWVPPSLAARAPLARSVSLPLGFAVVVREQSSGRRLWLAAPLARLAELKQFERRLADGNRAVTVTFRPRTGTIERLSAANDSAGDVDLRLDPGPTHPAGISFSP